MTTELTGEARCREMHTTGGLGEPVTWERCKQPPFGLVDLENVGVPPFPLCFHHLNVVAESAPYIPITPLPPDYTMGDAEAIADIARAGFRMARTGPFATCPDCGAVNWGNATCPTCSAHWRDHFEERSAGIFPGGGEQPTTESRPALDEARTNDLHRVRRVLRDFAPSDVYYGPFGAGVAIANLEEHLLADAQTIETLITAFRQACCNAAHYSFRGRDTSLGEETDRWIVDTLTMIGEPELVRRVIKP